MVDIDSFDFSVIIQGPILGKASDAYEKQLTIQCIESIRKVLPKAEIIISTWVGSEIEHIRGYDQIVLNEDPGAITYNDYELKNVYNNNNRQIISTFSGLKIAKRKYAIKMRSDFKIIHNGFMNYLNVFTAYNRYRFFNQRIIVPTLASRDPSKFPILFAISDLFQVGLTSDLYNLWNIPLQPEPNTTRAFSYSTNFLNDPLRFLQFKMQYSSEQYIWFAFSRKNNLYLDLKYYCQIPINVLVKSIVSIVDSFVILSPEQIGILPPIRLIHSIDTMISHEKWTELYKGISAKKSKAYLLLEIIKVITSSYKVILKNSKSNFKDLIKKFI